MSPEAIPSARSGPSSSCGSSLICETLFRLRRSKDGPLIATKLNGNNLSRFLLTYAGASPARIMRLRHRESLEPATYRSPCMRGFATNIERDTLSNDDFRRVLFTGHHIQLVVMSIPPGGEIGRETHEGHDQFIRVEAGSGEALMDGQIHPLSDGSAVVIPAGVEHNVTNTSADEPLRLYTLYSPPEHPEDTVQHTPPPA